MTWYEFLLFVHISASVVWIGAGFLLMVLAIRADRTGDEATLERILDDNAWLATHLFIPASLVVVSAGVLLVIDGPWEFDQLWLVLGLVGYLSTFLTGVAVLKPRGDRIAETIARDGGMTPVALAETRRLLALARIDYVTLFLVIAVMAIKPTGDDVALLIAMGAIFAAGVAWAISVAQSVTVPESAPASG
jgi:uncharacterized membrane protein